MIFLNHQNNYVRISNMTSNVAKSFEHSSNQFERSHNILMVQQNYFQIYLNF